MSPGAACSYRCAGGAGSSKRRRPTPAARQTRATVATLRLTALAICRTVIRVVRSSTIRARCCSLTLFGCLLGRELRSLSGSLALALRFHSRARRTLSPAALAAPLSDHPCFSTRSTSSARLAGKLRAFLCTSILVPPVRSVRFRDFQIRRSRPDGQPLSGNNVLRHHN